MTSCQNNCSFQDVTAANAEILRLQDVIANVLAKSERMDFQLLEAEEEVKGLKLDVDRAYQTVSEQNLRLATQSSDLIATDMANLKNVNAQLAEVTKERDAAFEILYQRTVQCQTLEDAKNNYADEAQICREKMDEMEIESSKLKVRVQYLTAELDEMHELHGDEIDTKLHIYQVIRENRKLEREVEKLDITVEQWQLWYRQLVFTGQGQAVGLPSSEAQSLVHENVVLKARNEVLEETIYAAALANAPLRRYSGIFDEDRDHDAEHLRQTIKFLAAELLRAERGLSDECQRAFHDGFNAAYKDAALRATEPSSSHYPGLF